MTTTTKIILAVALVAALVTSQQDRSATKSDTVEVGKPAPTFRLNDQAGRAVKVGSNDEGLWTALAFYPKAATPG